MDLHIEVLGPDDTPAILDVFCDAFADYPVMRYVLGPDGDSESRLRQLIGYFVLRRVRLGGPLFGARAADGTLAGVATMTVPVESVAPPDLLAARDRVFETLGQDCRARHDVYAKAATLFGSIGPHHHLNMLGVRHAWHGQGIGRCAAQCRFRSRQRRPAVRWCQPDNRDIGEREALRTLRLQRCRRGSRRGLVPDLGPVPA